MRAHDVAIGRAVAEARRHGRNVTVEEARPWLPVSHVLTWCHATTWGFEYDVDRGPVVRPAPLTDVSIAFGIAMADAIRRGRCDGTHRADRWVWAWPRNSKIPLRVSLDPRRWCP